MLTTCSDSFVKLLPYFTIVLVIVKAFHIYILASIFNINVFSIIWENASIFFYQTLETSVLRKSPGLAYERISIKGRNEDSKVKIEGTPLRFLDTPNAIEQIRQFSMIHKSLSLR